MPDGSSIWQLETNIAKLQLSDFHATLDLKKIQHGISNIVCCETKLSANLLALADQTDFQDAFIRGNDLVVSFQENECRPFSTWIYWRASREENGIIVLDMILSLQTRKWESYPQVTLTSSFAADNFWLVSESCVEEISGSETSKPWPLGCIVARLTESDYSYAEMVHPTDKHEWQLSQQGSLHTIHRMLGGTFLERGVIRRFRIRGAMLPRQNDFELAQEKLQSLIAAEPPLTA